MQGKKDISKLIPVKVTDKRGRIVTVYIDPEKRRKQMREMEAKKRREEWLQQRAQRERLKEKYEKEFEEKHPKPKPPEGVSAEDIELYNYVRGAILSGGVLTDREERDIQRRFGDDWKERYSKLKRDEKFQEYLSKLNEYYDNKEKYVENKLKEG
jgi:hypothetical protein